MSDPESRDSSDPGSARVRRPRSVQWPQPAWLTVVWVALWGDLSWANVLGGLVLALGVTLVFPLPPIRYAGRPHLIGLLRLLGRFVVDLVRANLQVTVAAYSLRRRVRSAVIGVQLREHSDLYLTLTAELVSLVPGSLLVEARRAAGVLYLHVLDVRGPEQIEQARQGVLDAEQRVVRALGSPAEIDLLDTDGEPR